MRKNKNKEIFKQCWKVNLKCLFCLGCQLATRTATGKAWSHAWDGVWWNDEGHSSHNPQARFIFYKGLIIGTRGTKLNENKWKTNNYLTDCIAGVFNYLSDNQTQ